MSHLFLSKDGSLPHAEHRDQIIPLDAQAAKFLWDFEADIRLTSFSPESGKYFRDVEVFASSSSPEKLVKKWLFDRGLPFSTRCFISFQPSVAFILPWKMVIHYSADLFFGHDVVVWDRSLNWALYYHHDDIFHFAKNRIYDGEAAQLKILELVNQIKMGSSQG